jgi:hypothetical protein
MQDELVQRKRTIDEIKEHAQDALKESELRGKVQVEELRHKL